MKPFINPKFLYFVIPLSFVFVCVITSANYLLSKEPKRAVFTLFLGFLTAVFYRLSMTIVTDVFKFPIFETWFALIYFYLLSLLFGIYVIKKQQKVFTNN